MDSPIHLASEYDDALACPVCGLGYTHIDQVMVAARQEDATPKNMVIDAITGYVSSNTLTRVPAGSKVGNGRRHRIALMGSCENGHSFSILFTQHKGYTYVEALEQTWVAR